MLGLMVLLAFLAYLAVSIGVIALAVRWAKKRNRKPWLWGGLAALVMYNLVFWDWMPTLIAHKYYCSTQAGFWVYKTPEEWGRENPGIVETLVDSAAWASYPNWATEIWQGKKIASVNQRIGLLDISHLSNSRDEKTFLNVWRWQTDLIDKQTGEVLARQIDFSTGNDGYIGGMHSLKLWLYKDGCVPDRQYPRQLGEFVQKFRGAKK